MPLTFGESAEDVDTTAAHRVRIPTFFFCFVCYVGLSLYNFGLIHGLDVIGDSVGHALPKAIKEYGLWIGGALILVFTLILGVGATIAEPGLTTFIYQVHTQTYQLI